MGISIVLKVYSIYQTSRLYCILHCIHHPMKGWAESYSVCVRHKSLNLHISQSSQVLCKFSMHAQHIKASTYAFPHHLTQCHAPTDLEYGHYVASI